MTQNLFWFIFRSLNQKGNHEMNLKNLKKMSTEKMHKLYTKLTGNVLFNPYEDRQLMITVISVEMNINDGFVIAEIDEKPNKIKQSGKNRVEMYLDNGQLRFRVNKSEKEIWWENNGNPNAPMPTKGRIPEFSMHQVFEILHMEIAGYTVKQIAEHFKTAYQTIYQILEGKNYQWVYVGA